MPGDRDGSWAGMGWAALAGPEEGESEEEEEVQVRWDHGRLVRSKERQEERRQGARTEQLKDRFTLGKSKVEEGKVKEVNGVKEVKEVTGVKEVKRAEADAAEAAARSGPSSWAYQCCQVARFKTGMPV